MIRALFVSDIHIVSSSDPKHGLFLRFLDKCLELRPERLFLVGDIFDLWISDRRYFVENYRDVIERIRLLRERGVEVHYFEGNHDLDLEIYWQYHLGVKIWTGATYFAIGEQVARVEHGDQMDLEDRGYLFLRWFLRTPVMRFFCRYLPDGFVEWIGRRASQASRNYTSNIKTTTQERTLAVMSRHAEKAYLERPFDLLITGHTHMMDDRLVKKEGASFRSVNLGTWLDQPMVLVITDQDESVQLKSVKELLG